MVSEDQFINHYYEVENLILRLNESFCNQYDTYFILDRNAPIPPGSVYQNSQNQYPPIMLARFWIITIRRKTNEFL